MNSHQKLLAIVAKNDRLELAFSPVPSHFASYSNGSRHRVELGFWNFNRSAFIVTASGDASTQDIACLACLNDYYTPPVMNEDEMMMNG